MGEVTVLLAYVAMINPLVLAIHSVGNAILQAHNVVTLCGTCVEGFLEARSKWYVVFQEFLFLLKIEKEHFLVRRDWCTFTETHLSVTATHATHVNQLCCEK